MTSAEILIVPVAADADPAPLNAHLHRHRRESDAEPKPFLPFTVEDPAGPWRVNLVPVGHPLTRPGWMRYWIARVGQDGPVVGHVDLKGDALLTGLHRCQLGIGIEQSYRGQGIGRRLLQAALTFARQADSLSWVDLRVFAHNTPARALYRRLGFVEQGEVRDRFRFAGLSVDDVLMTLNVSADSPRS